MLVITLNELLQYLGFSSIMSTMNYIILGSSIGISTGFGYAIAQTLFEASS